MCSEFSVEHGHFECGLRHPVTLEPGQPVRDSARGDLALHQGRNQEVPQHVLGPIDVFRGVERLSHRDALAPALAVRRHDSYEQQFPYVLGTERRPERCHQRHLDTQKFHTTGLHDDFSLETTYQPARSNPMTLASSAIRPPNTSRSATRHAWP